MAESGKFSRLPKFDISKIRRSLTAPAYYYNIMSTFYCILIFGSLLFSQGLIQHSRRFFGSKMIKLSLHAFENDPQSGKSVLDYVDITDKDKKSDKNKERKSIVLIAGFEQVRLIIFFFNTISYHFLLYKFNRNLYRKAAEEVTAKVKDLDIYVFTDADIDLQPKNVERALKDASVLFTSLVFDYQQIMWLKDRINNIPYRFCFESALELMSETRVGDFQMSNNGGGPSGPPAPVKAILKQFGSGKEEDRIAGYLKFLKYGPKLLNFVPGKKAKDLKTWLSVYSYWNQGAGDNVESMFYNIIRDLELLPVEEIPQPSEVRETPLTGITHPKLSLFDPAAASPRAYCEWYEREHSWVDENTPRVGILLYRKHVITEQKYIGSLISIMEQQGIMPVPIFINGVEAHTIVRDQLTTDHELQQRRRGKGSGSPLSEGCTKVDAIVNTIGFPLVGGPAGSMEGGAYSIFTCICTCIYIRVSTLN